MLDSRRRIGANGLLKFGGVVSIGVIAKDWNEDGGIVRLLVLSRRETDCDSCSLYAGKSRSMLLVAWTRGLVGALITKLDDKLLPKDGALLLMLKVVFN